MGYCGCCARFHSELFTRAVLKNPCVGFLEYMLYKRDVVAAEAGRFIPDAILLKEANNGHGVAKSGSGLLLPDAYSDQAFTKLVDR